MSLILFDESVDDSRDGRNGSTSSNFLCQKFQFEKMSFKKRLQIFWFFIQAYIFAYFLVWTFPTKVWTFPTKKCPQPYCHKGFQRRKRLQKVTKGINNPYIPFFLKKQVFSKRSKKSKNRIKPFFGFYVQTGWTLSDDYPQCCFSFQQRWRLDRSECFRGKREKEKFRKKKNREASTAGGCMLKTPKPI